MNADKNPNDPITVSTADIWRLCKRAKRKIFLTAALMAFAGALLALTSPVKYRVEATFREKTPKSANVNSTLVDLIFSGNIGNAPENEAVSILKSQKIIHPVINKMNLQAAIVREQDADTYRNRFQHNAIIEYALLSRKLYPILPDPACPLKVVSATYLLEAPRYYKVVFPNNDHQFHLLTLNGQHAGTGELNVPYISDGIQFTLSCSDHSKHTQQSYFLTFWPLHLLTTKIKKMLKVESDNNDTNLLTITFQNRDRHLAAQFVNTLMESYQDYLQSDHDRQASIQLTYLKKKQEESEQHLEVLMHKHAHSLSEDLSSTGFADSEKEMEFLAKSQHEFKERLISNELEIKRLQNVQTGKCVYYDQYSKNAGDHNIINSVLEEIRDLKQQRDALTLTLKKSRFLNTDQLKNAFQQQQEELKEVQANLHELNEMILNFQKGIDLNITSNLYQDPHYLIKTWYQRIEQKKLGSSGKEENEPFISYLDNLKRLFSVHEKIIKERLTHQQNPSLEYQGIHLHTAQELYLEYSKKLNELEAKKRENQFLIHQMQDPNFEITSLSTVLNDSVSTEMIQKASRLLLDLKDQNNRSDKEQEQLKGELDLERGFLLLHLQQTNQLLTLNQQLVEEKIYALQNVTLELIHQQISVLEKNLHDYIKTRLDNLKQERFIIEQHMDQLHQEMAALPKRWASEKMIEQNLQINELIVQEVAKMVESKNISHKLELIQSAPLDVAIPPIHPLSSGLILYSLLGAMLGGLLSSGLVMKRALSNGLLASTTNLMFLGKHVAGRFSTSYQKHGKEGLKDADFETLRRLQAYFNADRTPGECQSLLLIEGQGPDYASDLTTLFTKNGQKVITLLLPSDRPSSAEKPGLLQYLEGKAPFPTIHHAQSGDYMEAGGVTHFSSELLGTELFRALLTKLKVDYDWIIAVSDAKPDSAVAENLMGIFSLIAVTVVDETLQQLHAYIKGPLGSNKRVTFIMTAEDDIG